MPMNRDLEIFWKYVLFLSTPTLDNVSIINAYPNTSFSVNNAQALARVALVEIIFYVFFLSPDFHEFAVATMLSMYYRS